MPVKKVVITRQVADSVLTYSKAAFPREGILMLRGKTRKGVVYVESLAIPPMATHGEGFSSFNWWMLPIDLSFVGVAHSHPSGFAVPSQQDVLHASGRMMMIAGAPFNSFDCIKVYNSKGEPLELEVLPGEPSEPSDE